MKKSFSEQKVKSWLSANAPHIELLYWAGAAVSKSKFRDNNSGRVFELKFSYVKDCLKKNVNYPFGVPNQERRKPTQKSEAERWLQEHASHIEIVEWSGRASKESVFLDKQTNVKFKYKFSCLKVDLSRFPGMNPGIEKIDRAKKARTTLKQKRGVENVSQLPEVKKKVQETCLVKYGAKNPLLNKTVQEKAYRGKIKNGSIKTINGKTIREICKEKDISPSWANYLQRTEGDDALESFKKHESYLEVKIEMLLQKNNIQYEKQFQLENRFYDFRILKSNILIECNGNYWHCEKFRDRSYHKNKKDLALSYDYQCLFFREDEINDKIEIIESIILNKLKLNNKKIFARKCCAKILNKDESKKFFEENHLMGPGSGRTYALINDCDEIVCAMQIKGNNKKIEISRQCSVKNVNVVGGFSKLLKLIIETENPKLVSTFIDERYGAGSFLNSLGFVKKTNHISFVWTNGRNVHHRMLFKNGSGIDKGLFRLYDCGQSRYDLLLD